MQNPTGVIGKIRPGCNPRTYFDPAEMAELTESIRVDGVIQPILIRPVEDEERGHEYEVVAEEGGSTAADAKVEAKADTAAPANTGTDLASLL